jgi:hypothetical protein
MLKNRILLFTIVAGGLYLLFSGCAPVELVEKPVDVCPPEYNVLEAMAVLSGRWLQAVSFYANGQCLWAGRDADRKERKENFPIKIWVEPHENFCLHGDIFFDGRGLIAGANQEEFWLAIRPKELRGYLWGKQSTISQCTARLPLPMNPRDILEALGMIRFKDDSKNKSWRLMAAEDYDILINSDDSQNILKKVYVSRCNYLVRKIEYFNTTGDLVVVTELDKYRKVTDGFEIPSLIKIRRLTENGDGDTVKITLKSMKPKEFNEKQREFLFSKPPTKRFESILMLSEDCKWIEQGL